MPRDTQSAGSASREAHQHRDVAESFGTDAARYDRTRQPYPDALVERIVAMSPGPDVLDVGCGTGIAARQFQAAGCMVLGVEPDARMAEFARRRGTEVEVATFEDWNPAGRAFDVVIAATAWHWVDPAGGAEKAAQILRLGGCLALFGHAFEPPPEVRDASAAAHERVAPDSPFRLNAGSPRGMVDAYEAMYAKAAGTIRELGKFGHVQQTRYEWQRSYTRDEWLDQIPTGGGMTRLPPDKLKQVLDAVGAAIDTMGGGFTMPYTTVAVTAVRTDVV